LRNAGRCENCGGYEQGAILEQRCIVGRDMWRKPVRYLLREVYENMQTFSPASIQALKEALTHIYWRKKDLRSFIHHTIENNAIIATID
jgi:hypothetical protein